jgi:hypothetical protein
MTAPRYCTALLALGMLLLPAALAASFDTGVVTTNEFNITSQVR